MLTLAVFSVSLTAASQPSDTTRELLLENAAVRIFRTTVPPGATLRLNENGDTFVVDLQSEKAIFLAKGTATNLQNSSAEDTVDLLIQPKTHWDAEVRPCGAPMKCTRESSMGGEPIAWTTTLFTSGFLTATYHKVVRGGTLDSSYFSATGSDSLVFVPFTNLQANFGGTPESLKTGQPYFTTASEVEVTGKDSEVRWLVVRMHAPGKQSG